MVSGFNAGNRIGTGKRASVYRHFHLAEKLAIRSLTMQSAGCSEPGLDTDTIVDCVSEPLLAAEIFFCCLNRDMP